MRIPATLLAVAGLLAGCSVFDDQPSLLVGAWGGPDMLVVGTPAGATVQMACGQVTVASALRLDQPSGYVATGTYMPSYNNGLDHQSSMRLIVTSPSARDTAVVKVETLDQGNWGGDETFRVVPGQPVTFPDGRLCGE